MEQKQNTGGKILWLVLQWDHGLSVATKSSHLLQANFSDGDEEHRPIAINSVPIFREIPGTAMTNLAGKSVVHRSGRRGGRMQRWERQRQ